MPRNFLPSGTMRIETKLFGQWAETIRMTQGLNSKIKKASIKAQFKVCREIQKKVKFHLRAQDLNWKPLNAEYKARKANKGLSGKTLMAYQTYYNSIDVWQPGRQHFVVVGVRRGIYTRTLTGKKSRMEVAVIAAIHEFSSGRRIPRRPLWNPTIREIGGAKGIKKMYINSLVYWLRMAKVPVKQFQRMF
jgi:hypothetical protein